MKAIRSLTATVDDSLKGTLINPSDLPSAEKEKWQQEEGLKKKAKRNHKKIQHRLKYDWQGE